MTALHLWPSQSHLHSLNFHFDFCKMKQIINVFQRVVIGLNKRMYMKASGAMHVNALKNTSFYLETILEKAVGKCFEFVKISSCWFNCHQFQTYITTTYKGINQITFFWVVLVLRPCISSIRIGSFSWVLHWCQVVTSNCSHALVEGVFHPCWEQPPLLHVPLRCWEQCFCSLENKPQLLHMGKEVMAPGEEQKILSGSRVVKAVLEMCDFSREFSLLWCCAWLGF